MSRAVSSHSGHPTIVGPSMVVPVWSGSSQSKGSNISLTPLAILARRGFARTVSVALDEVGSNLATGAAEGIDPGRRFDALSHSHNLGHGSDIGKP